MAGGTLPIQIAIAIGIGIAIGLVPPDDPSTAPFRAAADEDRISEETTGIDSDTDSDTDSNAEEGDGANGRGSGPPREMGL